MQVWIITIELITFINSIGIRKVMNYPYIQLK